jgi:hypothetical protein
VQHPEGVHSSALAPCFPGEVLYSHIERRRTTLPSSRKREAAERPRAKNVSTPRCFRQHRSKQETPARCDDADNGRLEPGLCHQVRCGGVQGGGQPHKRQHGHCIVSSLYPTHVAAVDLCDEREPFL